MDHSAPRNVKARHVIFYSQVYCKICHPWQGGALLSSYTNYWPADTGREYHNVLYSVIAWEETSMDI
jgi:hypothetical protein